MSKSHTYILESCKISHPQLCRDCEVQTSDIEDFVNKSAELDDTMDKLLTWANAEYGALAKLEDVKPENLPPCLKVGEILRIPAM